MKSFYWYDQCVATLRGYVANTKAATWEDVQAFDTTHDQHREAIKQAFEQLRRAEFALTSAREALRDAASSTRTTHRIASQAAETAASNLNVHIASLQAFNASQACPERSTKP